MSETETILRRKIEQVYQAGFSAGLAESDYPSAAKLKRLDEAGIKAKDDLLEAALSSTEQETREKVVREVVAWLRDRPEATMPRSWRAHGFKEAIAAIERDFLSKGRG